MVSFLHLENVVNLAELPDEILISNIGAAAAVMDTDSEIDDVILEYENGEEVTYRELLDEASRRAELRSSS